MPLPSEKTAWKKRFMEAHDRAAGVVYLRRYYDKETVDLYYELGLSPEKAAERYAEISGRRAA